MAERAHPNLPDFRCTWVWGRRCKGLIPWPIRRLSPYQEGLIRRYGFCQEFVPGRAVLDVPCGMGWGTSLLRGAARLVGVDVSEDAIDEARRRYRRRAKFLVGSMGALPLADATFDVVLCLEGIEHVPVSVGASFVREAYRVLRPGGTMVVTSPVPDPCRQTNPYHVYEYTPDELQVLTQPWFRTSERRVLAFGRVEICFLTLTRCCARAPAATP